MGSGSDDGVGGKVVGMDAAKLEIKEISEVEDKDYWLNKIGESEWSAGKYLSSLLRAGSFYTLCGAKSKVFLLVEGSELMSFCTLAENDDVPDTDLTPWIGFVYTFPAFRGKRLIGKLIEHACLVAGKAGYKDIYVSTDQKGLYENFGFVFYGEMKDRRDEMSLVYRRKI